MGDDIELSRNPIRNLPLPALFVVISVLWAGLQLVFRTGDLSPLRILLDLVGGMLFAGVMTAVVAAARRRLGGTRQVAGFTRALRTGVVPAGADRDRWRVELDRLDRGRTMRGGRRDRAVAAAGRPRRVGPHRRRRPCGVGPADPAVRRARRRRPRDPAAAATQGRATPVAARGGPRSGVGLMLGTALTDDANAGGAVSVTGGPSDLVFAAFGEAILTDRAGTRLVALDAASARPLPVATAR